MTDHVFPMAAPRAIYRARRAQIAKTLARPLLIFGGRARDRNYAGNSYPFRAGSNFLYFGGPPVEGAAWLIEPSSDGDAGCYLFREVPNPDEAVWFGTVGSDDAISAVAGIGIERLTTPDDLAAMLAKRPAGYVCPPCPHTQRWIASLSVEPADPDELRAIIDMRLIKDQHELVAMREAADVSMTAHRAALAAAAPGRREADVLAALQGALTSHGCIPSFTPIVTVRGDILHAQGYDRALTLGSLLLVDAGAETPSGYASDITRTYPLNGSFSPIQRQLFDTVHRAHQAAIAACVSGRRYREVHDLAARVICEGLVNAGLLTGDPDTLLERRAHTLFFTHGVGHLIGLDVHDMEDFGDLAGYPPSRERRPSFGDKFLRLDRDLEAGMTVTIEPGIYLSDAVWQRDDLVAPLADVINRPAVDALLADHFGGIRIEDTVHVLSTNAAEPEVLTRGLAIEAEAV